MKLTIDGLTVAYDTGVVLQALSLEVHDGEFLSLLGPSGCGKTTLMKAIAGILPTEQGKILLGDTDISSLPVHKRGTVIMFQDMRLFPHMTAEDNVAFPLKMQGVSKTERQRVARNLLERVQMKGYEKRLPGELSGGQQQRVALARALAAQPKLLLLDEPFSALDENLREDMRNLVRALQKEFHMTVLLVTHDREEALSMSDRVAVMFDGSLLQLGTPKEVYSCPVNRRVADYFGDCVYLSRKNGQLMLRSSALQTHKPGNYPITVEQIQFRGSETLVLFRAGDGTLWRKTYSQTPDFHIGQQLQVTLAEEQGILFAEV